MCRVLERREGSAYGCRRYSGKPRQIYDNPTGNEAVPVTGPLAAYLALLHVCGPEALEREFVPEIDADIFSVWNAQLAPISRPCSSAKAVASFALSWEHAIRQQHNYQARRSEIPIAHFVTSITRGL